MLACVFMLAGALTAVMLLRPQALLWDCDGVLCDTERDGHRLAFNEAFKQKGAGTAVQMRADAVETHWCPIATTCVRSSMMRLCNLSSNWPGLPHEWSVEKYGELLTTGGGKERMTRYFKVCTAFAGHVTAARADVRCSPGACPADCAGNVHP